MSGLWILFLLVFVSAIPLVVVYVWFRIIRYPFSLIRFLISFLAGAAVFFPALLLQYFFPASVFSAAGRWALLFRVFIRIAFTEELSRLLVLLILCRLFSRFDNKTSTFSGSGESALLSYSHVNQGIATGLVAGLGFAVIESAVYGASNAGVLLLRTFTAAPLHGACGARVGAAAVMFQTRPSQAIFRFLSAAAIHGIYNFMIIIPGFPSAAALLIALSALASPVLVIHGSRKTGRNTT
jgi:RsiW-degrading membrane proteinase PrsW (M82 family)